ncbi:MAG: trigger factor [Fidelibacterota bacterium]
MDIKVHQPNRYTRELEIVVPWEEIEPDFEKAIKTFSKRVKQPGFRPGHVPRKVIMSNYLSHIELDFVEKSFNKYYIEALKEKDLTPVNQASISDLDFHYQSDLKFKATFEIEPEVTVPVLKKNSLKVEKTVYISDEEDINLAVDDIRRRYMNVVTVEDGAQSGHFIVCDLQQVDEGGVPLIGQKLEGRYIKIGDGIFTGDLEKQLIGLKAGDEVVIDTPDENDGTVKYRVHVTKVEDHQLPEVDESFVKTVDNEVKSVEEWKEKIRQSIDDEYTQRSEEALERQLADSLIEKADIEYPPSMVAAYLEHLMEDVKKSNPGTPLDEEQVRKTYTPVAERNMKWYLLRKAIIREQDLTVSREEVQVEIQRLKDRSPDYAKDIEKYYKKPSNREKIEDDLMEKKILEYIKQFAKIKEVKVHTKDIRSQANEEA